MQKKYAAESRTTPASAGRTPVRRATIVPGPALGRDPPSGAAEELDAGSWRFGFNIERWLGGVSNQKRGVPSSPHHDPVPHHPLHPQFVAGHRPDVVTIGDRERETVRRGHDPQISPVGFEDVVAQRRSP